MSMKCFVKGLILYAGSLIYHETSPKVVFYHDIGKTYTPMGTDARVFFEHMRVIVGENSGSGREGKHVVAFDDGFRGVWEYRDELEKVVEVGVRVIVFVAVRLVGQSGYLTWDEIRTLQNEYGIEFQCHSWSHQTLVGPMIDESPKEERTEAWYHRELVESREKIAAEIGAEVDELCFPVGYFSDELIERCKAAGYKKVYASYPGNLVGVGVGVGDMSGREKDEGYVQPRCLVQDLGPLAFKAVLRGGMMMFFKRYFRKHYCV